MQRTTGANEIFFTDVVVPEENILGELDKGFYQLLMVLNKERILVGAHMIGLSEGALDEALSYAKKRVAFGHPIGQFQAIQHRLAECYIRIEAAKTMVYKAAWLHSRDMECGMESNACKVFATEVAYYTTRQCLHTFGGYGAYLEYPINRYYRDCSIYSAAPVTDDLARSFIGERLGLGRSY